MDIEPAPVLIVVGWFVSACVVTYSKRYWQAFDSGRLPSTDRQPPVWTGVLIYPQYALLGCLAAIDWSLATTVFLLTFVLSVLLSFVMENIGAVITVPITRLTGSNHRPY